MILCITVIWALFEIENLTCSHRISIVFHSENPLKKKKKTNRNLSLRFLNLSLMRNLHVIS